MPHIQEFTLHDPSMMQDRYYVEIPAGASWQRWEHPLLRGDTLECQLEEPPATLDAGPQESNLVWVPVEVGSWYIDDGSGNAPGANAHFFFIIRREGKAYRLDLDGGLRVRLEAPTTEELAAMPKRCEGIELIREGTRWSNEEWGPCSGPGIYLIGKAWYCESCATSKWVASPELGTQTIIDADILS
jgi:hypothetical protein